MILYLDTSAEDTIIKINDDEYHYQVGRDLAKDIFTLILDSMERSGHPRSLKQIKKIIINPGPGSFTGLRIGITVANTLADTLKIPLETPDGKIHTQITPEYGRPANITPPKH